MATPISKVTLTIDNKDYIFGLQQATQETKKFGNEAAAAFTKADTASNKMNLSATNLTGGLIKLRGTLATIGLGAFAVSALKSADAISDLSDATDISIGKLLEFQKGLQLSGGQADDAAKAITTFYDSIRQANEGSDKTQEQFAKLGITLRDLKTLSEEDLLDKTLKGFRNIQDPVTKSTIAVDMFGKSFRTVDPNRLADELENLRGKFAAEESATKQAADAIEKFENFVTSLKGAVVLALEPFLKFFGAMDDGKVNVRALAGALQGLAAAYVAIRVAALGAAVAQAAVGAGLKGRAAGALTGVAAGTAAYLGLKELMDQIGAGPQAGQNAPLGPNASIEAQLAEEARLRAGQNRDIDRRNREQQIGKELKSQLDSVNGLMEGYRRAAQANMDRYVQEVDLLGKTEYEQELIKGTADIEKRYGDQIAALEDKKKNAKGQTLALIQQSINELKDMKTSELDIFEITKQQSLQYKLQQDEIKRIGDEIDKLIVRQQRLGDTIRTVNDQRVDIQNQPLYSATGVSSLQKRIIEIRENARKAALEAGRAFAGTFEGEDGLTAERAQEMADGLAKISEAYRRLTDDQIKFAEDQYEVSRQFSTGWDEAFAQYAENAMNAANQAKTYFDTFTKGFEDAIVALVTNGKWSFKDFANSIIADFARIEARKMMTNMMGGAGGGGIVGSIITWGKGLLGLAGGGPVASNTPYIVGERGPELFMPRSAGQIIPNSRLGGLGQMEQQPTSVVYNIQAVDASSFRSLVARDPGFIYAVTEKGRQSQPRGRLA